MSSAKKGRTAEVMATLRASVSQNDLRTTGGASLYGKGATSPSVVSSNTEDEALLTSGKGGARLGAQLSKKLSMQSYPDELRTSYRLVLDQPEPSMHLGSPKPSSRTKMPFQVGKMNDEDVFTSPAKPSGSSKLTASSAVFTPRSADTAGLESPAGHTLRYRASDLGVRHQVCGIDAQTYYPPTACVFVANLPEMVKDQKLEAEVTRHFSKYGVVFVKIRRDQKNMPFAFCQYTNDEDARVAMNEGRGAVIHGRACRTEMVKANRKDSYLDFQGWRSLSAGTYILYNHHGADVSVEQARKALEPYGSLSKCEPLHAQLQEAMGIGKSVLFEYPKFDPNRDIQNAFKYHTLYRVVPQDIKKSLKNQKVDADEAWLQQYEVDRRSIYIGNLPSDVDTDDLEEQIRVVAAELGDVISVQVVQKEGRNGHPPNVFSFVEFARPDMADHAIRKLMNTVLFDCEIRVERKATKDPGSHTARRMRSQMAMNDAYRSPAHVVQAPRMQDPSSPLTPSRPTGVGSGRSSTGSRGNHGNESMMPYAYMPYGGQTYSTANYTTSPYGGHGYVPSPQAHSTPQHVAGSPYGAPYFPAAYPWTSPYVTDPNVAAMAYYQGYGQIPAQPVREDGPDTPTKAGVTGGSDKKDGRHGKH